MKTFDRITDLIGGTPLLKLTNYIADKELGATIYARLEYFNPAGSVKDRIAKAMIDKAEANGLLKPGAVIIGADQQKYRNRTCSGGCLHRRWRISQEQNPNVKVVAIEAVGSSVLSNSTPDSHKIQGIGAFFVPKYAEYRYLR